MKDTQIRLNDIIGHPKLFMGWKRALRKARAADFIATSKGGALFASVAAGVPKVGTAAAPRRFPAVKLP
jgi:hypothetical protein